MTVTVGRTQGIFISTFIRLWFGILPTQDTVSMTNAIWSGLPLAFGFSSHLRNKTHRYLNDVFKWNFHLWAAKWINGEHYLVGDDVFEQKKSGQKIWYQIFVVSKKLTPMVVSPIFFSRTSWTPTFCRLREKPSKFNMSPPQKGHVSRGNFIVQPSIFRGCMSNFRSIKKKRQRKQKAS